MIDIYVLSDSLGNTATDVVRAALAQFDLDIDDYRIKKIPAISSKERIDDIFVEIRDRDIVVQTLVEEDLASYSKSLAEKRNILLVDILSDLLKKLSISLDKTIKNRPGQIRKLGEDYFRRVDALEFAVRYDDGKDINGLIDSDIIIIGVSRTSKTPLSMYLANKNIKVMNLPLVPEIALPKEIYEIDKRKIIGLTTSIDHLNSVRKERMKSLGVGGENSYSSELRIFEELEYANDVMKKLGCPIINVENKAIEETAEIIIEIIKERGINITNY